MTAAMAGMPPTGYGPGRPLPGGRDGRGDGEREARRIAARLAAAQRRLGRPESPVEDRFADQVGPTMPTLPAGIIVDLTVAASPEATSRTRATIRRIFAPRRPRRRA